MMLGGVGAALTQSNSVGKSGLPLPRFVSLKSGKVNMRVGPGPQYQLAWQYSKRGLPVEIIQEFENWRKVRDPNGDEGWIFHSLLTGKRTAIVKPWESDKETGRTRLHNDSNASSKIVAEIEPSVVVDVVSCDPVWCQIEASDVTGYVEKTNLWGVYPDEQIEE